MTFRELLGRLETRCNCNVTKLDDGGIPDPVGGLASGALYLIERKGTIQPVFLYIEVFDFNVQAERDYVTNLIWVLGIDPGCLYVH